MPQKCKYTYPYIFYVQRFNINLIYFLSSNKPDHICILEAYTGKLFFLISGEKQQN